MLCVTVTNRPGTLSLSVGPANGRSGLRRWRGRRATRILDRSLPGWRALGSFTAEGSELVRRIFLAATAEVLAFEDEAQSEGDSDVARHRFVPGRADAGACPARHEPAHGRVPLPAGS